MVVTLSIPFADRWIGREPLKAQQKLHYYEL